MTTVNLTSARHEVADAFAAIEHYFEQGWTDGLPIVPPTEERVQEFLVAAGLPPGEVLGKVPNRGRTITAEKVAINAVMAGCRPDYMPVVVAAVRALADARFNLHGSMASTAGAGPLLIVHGPVARRIGVNAGDNVFGPGWRANATIGRALRLVLMNACAARPGIMDKATLGHPGKYTYCIAELEAESPWEPLHVDRGLARETSAVTVLAGEAPHYARNDHGNRPETILATIADVMTRTTGRGNSYLVVMGPLHVAVCQRHGWTKANVREFLIERAARTVGSLKRDGWLPDEAEPGDENRLLRWIEQPDRLMIVVAGGKTSGSSAVVPPWPGRPCSPVTLPVRGG